MEILHEALLQKEPPVVGRVIDCPKHPIAELLIEIRRLERKGVEMGRVAAEHQGAPLGLGDESPADAAPAQIRMDPEIVYK